MVGKAEVREWAEGYLQAFTTHWDKTSQEFMVEGEWRVMPSAQTPDSAEVAA